jgi:hypothetical protein
MIRQTFRKESMSRTQVFEWKSPNSQRLKKATQMKGKVRNMLIIFFDIKRIIHKKFILGGQ